MSRRPSLALALLLVLLACGGGGGRGSGGPADPIDPPVDALLTIVTVGDTHGHRIFEDDLSDPLAEVAGLVEGRDLLLLNHEGAFLPPAGEPVPQEPFPNQSLFTSSPRIADYLSRGGATVATLANNHVLDAGGAGLTETIAAFEARGIDPVGAGADATTARAPVILEVRGVRVGVAAFLAMDPALMAAGPAAPGAAAWGNGGAETVAGLTKTCDFVIAALHLHLAAGWTDVAAPEHRAVVEEALAAGADLVVGHGPHVPQGIVVRDGGIGLLSVGNFLFRPDYELEPAARRSVVAEAALLPDRLTVTLRAIRLDATGRPRIPTEREAEEILRGVAFRSQELGTAVEIRDGAALLSVPRTPD